ncbi:hypothetical protein [Acetobacterium wieringae]|nr:hypothetical protein [Acetobacterium wieringae]
MMFAMMATTACTITAIEWFSSGFMLGLTAYAATRDTIRNNQ